MFHDWIASPTTCEQANIRRGTSEAPITVNKVRRAVEHYGRRPEATPLRIGEVQARPAQMFFGDAVFFTQIGNDTKLAPIHPPSEGDQEYLPSDCVEHPPSLPATPAPSGSADFSDSTARAQRS
jgi:hypothetical protein